MFMFDKKSVSYRNQSECNISFECEKLLVQFRLRVLWCMLLNTLQEIELVHAIDSASQKTPWRI